MRQSARAHQTVLAALFAAALVGAGSAPAEELAPVFGADEARRMTAPGLASEESGVPPPALRLRAIVARAWEDSIATWKRLMPPRAGDVEMASLRFVTRLAPNNCYGLYAGEGPAYCSGNRTVFVGTDAADRLMAQLGPHGEAGITFLIGHEIGHHIQNIQGRFNILNYMLTRVPRARSDLARRFELEADCYAGVWMQASVAWAQSANFRAQVLAVLGSIGDDRLLAATPGRRASSLAVHGTSAERRRWFLRGAESGELAACDMFAAARPSVPVR